MIAIYDYYNFLHTKLKDDILLKWTSARAQEESVVTANIKSGKKTFQKRDLMVVRDLQLNFLASLF